MKHKFLLISVAIATFAPGLALATQAPASAPSPATLAPSTSVQESFNTFNKDFAAFSNLAEQDAIAGPDKLKLARQMRADAQAWFNAMQQQYVDKAKENAGLQDELSKLRDELSKFRTNLSSCHDDLTRTKNTASKPFVAPVQQPHK